MKRFVLALLMVVAVVPAIADDGMWMPQQIPAVGDELKKLGLQIDPAQFTDLTGFPMGAIVQTNGCSASFVSPDGLAVTNHHCVYNVLQYLSTPQSDYVRDGFLARDRSQELQASPDTRIWVTTAIDDVTKTILAPLPKKSTDADRSRIVTRRRREMVEQCEKPGSLRCSVASFYEGAQFVRITQMEIRDVRLVYAPALGVGNFGDEIDNWMWPRHTGDFGFYRAYVGPDGRSADYSKSNVPYKPKHWLKVSTRDLDENDLVLIAGFPGVTKRHVTAAEVEDAQEFELPVGVRYRTQLIEILRKEGARDRETMLKNTNRIAGLENYQKKFVGTLEAYHRSGILEAKKKQEAAIRGALDPELGARYDKARAELMKILDEKRATRERDNVFAWLYTASPMLTQANNLYRLSVERKKADLDRADDYTERNRKRLEGTLARTRRSFDVASDRAGLRVFLLEAAKLPANQRIEPVDAALASTGKSLPEEQVDALLDRIYSATKLGNAEEEAKMFAETTAQLEARNDSMIAFAASLRPFANARAERDAMRDGAMLRLRPVMLEALGVASGGRLYPDANSTLRVGFGVVKGYSPKNAVWYQPQTDIRGVVEKTTGEEPFVSPQKLLDAAAAKKFGTYADPEVGSLPVDFLTTNVVTNGSSGSASLNAWGELCGLAFDSNWEGVGSDYMVEESITRTVHLDSRYMLWVMDAVDGAGNLLQEMGIAPQF